MKCLITNYIIQELLRIVGIHTNLKTNLINITLDRISKIMGT